MPTNGILTRDEHYLYRGYLRIATLHALNGDALVHAILWDPSEPEATRPLGLTTSDGTHYSYGHDFTKNVTEMLDETGRLVASYEYDPYGRTVIESGSCAHANPLGFSSEITDRETGTMYYNYRDYNPTDGRWLTRDPIEEQGGRNLYRFVENQPVNSIDIIGNVKWEKKSTLEIFTDNNGKVGHDEDEYIIFNSSNIGLNGLAITQLIVRLACTCKKTNKNCYKVENYEISYYVLIAIMPKTKGDNVSPLGVNNVYVPYIWVRERELEHKEDQEKWPDQNIKKYLEEKENEVKKQEFKDEHTCLDKRELVIEELRSSVLKVLENSYNKWDKSGKHVWGHPNQIPANM